MDNPCKDIKGDIMTCEDGSCSRCLHGKGCKEVNKECNMNNREAMEALLAGKKLTRDNWSSCDYIEFDIDKGIIDQNGAFELFRHSSCWEIYEAPKSKIVKTMYQFVVKDNYGQIYVFSALFGSEEDFLKENSCCKILKTIEHKIEVEE